MNELGIGEALEKLIEVLQLEGHEIFRIFTEVQPAMAICNAIVVLFGFVGTILGVVLLYKTGKKRNWFHDCGNDSIIATFAVVGVICLFVSLVLGVTITNIYLHVNYPEYFAAKELISSLLP